MQNALEQVDEIDSSLEDDRYLIFKVCDEVLAAPLLSIREIVEPLSYRPVLNQNDFYLGLANLRGQVVGVVDLGLRLGFVDSDGARKGAFLIFEIDGSSMAAVVTSVNAVVSITEDDISSDGNVNMKIPTKALKGIAQYDEHLIPIIHLSALVENISKGESGFDSN